MKKIMILLALMVSVLSQAATTTEPVSVSREAKKSFEKKFPGALYAKWERVEDRDIYLVRFGYKETSVLAYIDGTGDLLGTVRLVLPAALPFSVSEKLATKYNDHDVLKIEELTIDGETSYLVLLDNEKSRLSVRMFVGGDSYQMKKERK